MSATLSLTRRGFLKSGALAGAGLVIAFHVPDVLAAAAVRAAGTALEPNAWLKVGPDGTVTVVFARTEMGQGSSTGLPMLVAEELEADWAKVRFVQASPAPEYGDMGTGGSESIRSMWEPLRKAGAQAREMLIGAAAKGWGVDRASCHAERGEVVHAATGRRLAYGALAAKAATLPVPKDPPLKDRKDWRIISTSPARLDGPSKVDGSARFGLDVRPPGMLVAAVARCPVFGGKAASHDAAPALAIKGVRRVLPISSGVAVVADSYWAARKGVEALPVKWDEGGLARLSSAEISRKFAELAQTAGPVVRKEGNGAAALEGAARRIEAVYETPYLAHATMEPMNCTAWVKKGACEVWVSSQNATRVQQRAAELTGLPLPAVKVHLMLVGGGFGRRHEQDFVSEALELSKVMGAPVKVVWSREDDMQHDLYRPATYHLLRAGLDASGAPVAWTHRMVGSAILGRLYPQAVRNGVDPTSIDVAANLPYAFPNIQVESIIHEPGVPVGFWRSVSASQNAYAVECFLDEVATAASRDPLELRRALLKDKPRHRAVLELAAQKAGWGSPLPRGQGRGLAVVECFGSFVAHVAEVEVGPDAAVRVRRVVCAVDCGTAVHPDLVVAQMESGLVYGLSAALHGEITLDQGRVKQTNFNDYPIVTMAECPVIEVHLAPSGDAVGGIGEPGLPAVAPAVVNAVYAASGTRVRALPITAEALKRG